MPRHRPAIQNLRTAPPAGRGGAGRCDTATRPSLLCISLFPLHMDWTGEYLWHYKSSNLSSLVNGSFICSTRVFCYFFQLLSSMRTRCFWFVWIMIRLRSHPQGTIIRPDALCRLSIWFYCESLTICTFSVFLLSVFEIKCLLEKNSLNGKKQIISNPHICIFMYSL